MNFNYKQSQFELFPGAPGSSSEVDKPRYLFANLTLSMENMIVMGILLMMLLVFSFSLGIERGKKVARINWAPVIVPKENKMTVDLKNAVVTKPLSSSAVTSGIPAVTSGVPQIKMNPQSPLINQSAPANSPLEESNKKPYTIQVASFKNEGFARKEAQDLEKKGQVSLVLGKGQHFIVCVGKFVSENEAKIFSGRLKKQYKDLLVRRL